MAAQKWDASVRLDDRLTCGPVSLPEANSPRRERPGTAIRGPWMIVATLGIALLTPLATVLIFRAVDDPADDRAAAAPLVWADRADWPQNQFVAYKSLERGMMSSARTNQKYKDLGFHVEPAQQARLLALAELARWPQPRFAAADTRAQLDAAVTETGGHFYAYHLRATWHRLSGDRAAADSDRAAAFAAAPAALITGPALDGGDTLAFAADQIVGDRLDRTLVLVYPFLAPDNAGQIHLPVYKTILRRADPAVPAGVAEVDEHPRWFTWFGRVGRLPALGERPDPTVVGPYRDAPGGQP